MDAFKRPLVDVVMKCSEAKNKKGSRIIFEKLTTRMINAH